jgi:DNA-binding MarR family transcriptional regulator
MKGHRLGNISRDHVDLIIEQWNRERPDLDLSSVAVIARVSRLSRLLEANLERVLESYGINASGFGVLAALRRAGHPYRLSPNALHRSQLVTSAAITNRLDRLAIKGLISRGPDPQDRRRIVVALTKKGRELIDEVITAHVQEGHRLLATLGSAEKERVSKVIRKALLDLENPRGVSKAADARRE